MYEAETSQQRHILIDLTAAVIGFLKIEKEKFGGRGRNYGMA
jgi:hypothetical protein